MSKKKSRVCKVPVIMQMEALECGAACVSMILAYHGKWIPLEQARRDCGVSRDGSRASNMVKAARAYGMETKAYKLEPDQLRELGTMPCIVHWEFNHFVVVRGFRGKYVYLNDPARGEIRLTAEEFDMGFTGVAIFMEPTAEFEKSGEKKTVRGYMRRRCSGFGGIVLLVILAALAEKLLSVFEPGFSNVFYDRLLTDKDPDWLVPFTVFFGMLCLLKVFAEWIRSEGERRGEAKLDAVGSTSFMWKVLRLPMEFFSQRMGGDILSRENSSSSIADSIIHTLAPIVLDVAVSIVWLLAMLRYNVTLTVIGLAAMAVEAAVNNFIAVKQTNVVRASMKNRGLLAGYTVNGISMIETIKASGSESGYFEKWAGYQAGANAAEIEYGHYGHNASLINATVNVLCDVVITGISLWLITRGEYTIGMMNAFAGYLTGFTAPVTGALDAIRSLQMMRTEMDRVEDVMDYPEDPVFSAVGSETDDRLSGLIEMKNVTFGYSRLEKPLIEDFNLTVKPGGTVALVGGSGSGKSTLGKLICGLYMPWEGEILFDGKRVTEIDRMVFNGSLSMVDQEITIFNDTIRDNIRMWDETINDETLVRAAKDAQIHDDILQREDGYGSMLAEGGRDMSGGQRQRLEIARVLARDPAICILDEATSALDAETEARVIAAIRKRGITCVIVAHRLSTIRDCDEIIVLEDGKVAERGTHAELIGRHGAYARLVTSD